MPLYTRVGSFRAGGGGVISRIGLSSVYQAGSNTTVHTLSSFDINITGTNRVAIIGMAASENDVLNTLTYNGQALTETITALLQSFAGLRMYHLLKADFPAAGNLVATFATNAVVQMFIAVYAGMAQTAPTITDTDDVASGTTLNAALVGVTEGSLIFDLCTSSDNTTYTAGGTGTPGEIVDINGTTPGFTIAASERIGVAAGTYNITQTPDGTQTRQLYMAAAWEAA